MNSYKLTSTQKGAIAENYAINEIVISSNGRLSPFQPMSDDDGIDVLFYDKETGNATPIQIKARTRTIWNKRQGKPGNQVHFEIRKETFDSRRSAYVLCVLLSEDCRIIQQLWLIPFQDLPKISHGKKKYVIRPNKSITSKDKFRKYQKSSFNEIVKSLL